MFKRFFAALLLAAGASLAASAAELVSLDLNYYSEGPISIKVDGKLPKGVTML